MMKKTKYNELDEEVEYPKLVSYVLYYPRDFELIPKTEYISRPQSLDKILIFNETLSTIT